MERKGKRDIQGESKKKKQKGKDKHKGKWENYFADSGCDMQASESTVQNFTVSELYTKPIFPCCNISP